MLWPTWVVALSIGVWTIIPLTPARAADTTDENVADSDAVTQSTDTEAAAPETRATEDVVYIFDDGSIHKVRGTITREDKGGVTIRTADGKTRSFSRDKIAKVVRDQKTSSSAPSQYSRPSLQSERPSLPERTGGYGATGSPDNPGYEHKSPTVALLLSILIPGGGQMYNGDYKKGVVQLGAVVAGMVAFTAFYPVDSTDYIDDSFGSVETGNAALSYGGLALGVSAAIWSIVDAPMTANRRNQTAGWAEAPADPEGVRLSVVSTSMSGEVTPGLALGLSF